MVEDMPIDPVSVFGQLLPIEYYILAKHKIDNFKRNKILAKVQVMFPRIIKDIVRVFGQVYKEFSLESTIHGFKYTTLAKTRLERYPYLIVIIH